MIVPLVALLATSGLLAPEIDDGSISYLLAKPISRHTIVVSKLVVAVGLRARLRRASRCWSPGWSCSPATPSFAVGFARRRRWSAAWRTARSSRCCRCMTRHAVVIGLIYLLVWEGLLGGLLDGIRWLSITRWSAEIVDQIADLELVDNLPLAYAVIAPRRRHRRRHLADRLAGCGRST